MAPDAGADSGDAGVPEAASGEGGIDARPEDAATDALVRDSSGDASDAGTDAQGTIVLAADVPNASRVATDGNRVFWVDWAAADGGQPTARLMSVPVGGGTEVSLASAPGVMPTGLALDANDVYWTTSDGVLRQVAKSGGTATQLATGVAGPVTASNGVAFYAVAGDAGVSKIAADGGTPLILSTTGAPFDLVVVAGYVFWADPSGEIMYVPSASGGTPAPLVAPDPDAGSGEYVSASASQNLATDGTSLYWNRLPGSYAGAVMSVSVAGGAPQVVTNTGSAAPQSVTTDGIDVYFLDLSATAGLAFAPVTGGSPVTVAALQNAAALSGPGPTVAVDSNNVYWLDPPRVLQLAK